MSTIKFLKRSQICFNHSMAILFFFIILKSFSQTLESNIPPGCNFNLSAFKLQTINNEKKYKQVMSNELINGFESQYFYTGADGAMVFEVPSDAEKTSSNTKFPRNELRQNNVDANWSIKDPQKKVLSASCKVISVAPEKPQTIIAQIHGSQRNSELLKLRWTGYLPETCEVEARFQKNDETGKEYGVVLASCLSLGDLIHYTVTMKKGKIFVNVNGNIAEQSYTTEFYEDTDKYYFKAGNYIQFNHKVTVTTGRVDFYKLQLNNSTHN